jgi:1A family penicillin-binding protein
VVTYQTLRKSRFPRKRGSWNRKLLATRQYENAVVAAQFARRLFVTGGKVGILAVIGLVAFFAILIGFRLMQVPNLAYLENYKPSEAIEVFDRFDHLICSVKSTEKRKLVTLEKVSTYLQKAVLTAEDRHFYEHQGINLVSVVRAALSNAFAGHVVEGGSTITQQLVKNLFFEGEKRSVDLKLAEAMVAWQLESKFSKEKILELYLNEIYFGNGAYGIEQAARRYFGKGATQLTIAEGAFLAGIIRYPNIGSSSSHRRETLKRQHDVLNSMHDCGYINDGQWQEALNQKLVFKRADEKETVEKITKYPYYVSYVMDLVRDRFSQAEMQRHGLKVYTNLDPGAQDAAERVLSAGIAGAPSGINQGALASIRVDDGAVVALVGGVGRYEDNQWNCATNPHTMGSAFKPFVYLTAFLLEQASPESYVDDTPFKIRQGNGQEYKPQNFDKRFLGTITVKEALAFSRNIPALRTAQAAGINNVISTAKSAGIESDLAPELALALGCSAASPLEMANAYATLARGGTRMRAIAIRRVEDRGGRTLLVTHQDSDNVFDIHAVAQIVDLMQDVVASGTGVAAKLADRPVAGKTGTADKGRDIWFVGFTPDLVTAVWAGNADNKPVAGTQVTGGAVMARLWREYNKLYYLRHPKPPGTFIACTRVRGDFNMHMPKAEEVTKKQKPIVIYHPEESYTYTSGPSQSGTRSQAATPVRAGRGVNEYKWSR